MGKNRHGFRGLDTGLALEKRNNRKETFAVVGF
jgi:hypothetical protein